MTNKIKFILILFKNLFLLSISRSKCIIFTYIEDNHYNNNKNMIKPIFK